MTPRKKPKPHTQVPHADRKAAGLVRLDVYLGTEAAKALVSLVARLGSRRAAVEWALTQAPEPRT